MKPYDKAFQSKALAQLLPPQSQSLKMVSQTMRVNTKTLKRWLSNAQQLASTGSVTTGIQRLDAVVATASLSQIDKWAWCREHGPCKKFCVNTV
jgi:transposase-like protein